MVEIFGTRADWLWGPPSLLYHGCRVFPGDKTAGAWRWPPTSSSAKVKERVVLYLYSPSGPSWSAIGWPLLSPLLFYVFHIFNTAHVTLVFGCDYTVFIKWFVQSNTTTTYSQLIHSLATCFGSSEPSSGQYLIYGAFSESAQYGIPYCLQTSFLFKFSV